MGPPATGDVALRQHRQLGRGQHEPALEGLDDDAPAGRQALAALDQRERHAFVGEQLGEATGGALAVRRDDHAEAVGQQLAELFRQTGTVAHHRVPSACGDDCRARALRCGRDRADGRIGVREQAVEGQVEARPVAVGARSLRRV